MSMIKIKNFLDVSVDRNNSVLFDGAESTAYTSYAIDKGYGNIASVGARVQKGAKVKATVRIQMEVISIEEINKVFESHKSVFTDSNQREIQHHLSESNAASGIWGIFSGLRGTQSRDTWDKETNIHSHATDESSNKVVEAISKLNTSTVEVFGDIEITGYSLIPTEASLFIKVCTIEFENGNTLQVVDTGTPIAANASGDPSAAKVSGGKLNIKLLK